MAAEYKRATRLLQINGANAYGPGDRVHEDVIKEHFAGDDFADAFVADTPAQAEKIAEAQAAAGPATPPTGGGR